MEVRTSTDSNLIRDQLAVDRGPDADCVPLYLSGSRGSLFKVGLSSYGYTLVTKGVEGMDAALLCHEKELYDHIRGLQGKYVPVCLGTVDLIQPYYYDSGVFKHFLFMSYAGQPVFKYMEQGQGRRRRRDCYRVRRTTQTPCSTLRCRATQCALRCTYWQMYDRGFGTGKGSSSPTSGDYQPQQSKSEEKTDAAEGQE
jgi:hypothetical protein